ncbi:MAG: helix-turn-helix domain-containing protein [Bdellovibrionales bacterium]
MIEAKQIRAARGLLDWTREDLAKASGVSTPALGQIETENRTARSGSLDKIKAAFENAGVVFTDNSGVKLKSDLVTIYEGTEGVREFFDNVYAVVSTQTPLILVGGGFQQDFFDNMDKEYLEFHKKRLEAIPGFEIRTIKPASLKDEKPLDYVKFRVLPDHMFSRLPFYLYHNNLGVIRWKPTPRIVVIRDQQVAEAYHHQFDLIWKVAKRPESVGEE